MRTWSRLWPVSVGPSISHTVELALTVPGWRRPRKSAQTNARTADFDLAQSEGSPKSPAVALGSRLSALVGAAFSHVPPQLVIRVLLNDRAGGGPGVGGKTAPRNTPLGVANHQVPQLLPSPELLPQLYYTISSRS